MDFIGGIDGMNFTPITNYNNYLNNNKTFDIDLNNSFENVLNQQTLSMQNNALLQGSVSLNNFDDVMNLNLSSLQQTDLNPSANNFLNSLSNSITEGLNSVNDKINASSKAQEAFAMGEDISAHDIMIAAEKASLSFNMAMQLRNKMLSAYNEINNVRV